MREMLTDELTKVLTKDTFRSHHQQLKLIQLAETLREHAK